MGDLAQALDFLCRDLRLNGDGDRPMFSCVHALLLGWMVECLLGLHFESLADLNDQLIDNVVGRNDQLQVVFDLLVAYLQLQADGVLS